MYGHKAGPCTEEEEGEGAVHRLEDSLAGADSLGTISQVFGLSSTDAGTICETEN